MKVTISTLSVVLLLVPPAGVKAQFDYTTNADGVSITITGYIGPPWAVTVPINIDGLTVTSIGYDAFYDSTNVTGVTIPDSVTSIGIFGGCTSLTNVRIGDSVTNIVSWAFFGCTNLSTLTIGNSVTSIGDYAFDYCTSLTNITIPMSVTSLGFEAFASCASLTNITIPGGVTGIKDEAFSYCTSLLSIAVDTNNPAYSSVDGVLFDKSQSTLIEFPGGRAGNYSIPDNVTSIGDWAFYFCTNLTSVTIVDSVTNVGNEAFMSCASLTTVTIGDGVTSIGESAFSGSSLSSVTIPSGVTSIGQDAFLCALTAITVDTNNPAYSSVNGVLFDKSQTMLIQFPIARTGNYTIPDSVIGIEYDAFNGSSLTSITIPGSVTSIGGDAFMYSGLTNITIPNSVTNIGTFAFGMCYNLTNVTIGDNVTSIGESAFLSCLSLTNVTIPGSVSSIGQQAFADCARLTSLTIADGVTSIGNSAFEDCTGLTNVTIPSSVTNIGAFAFRLSGLSSVYFRGNAPSVGLLALLSDNVPTAYYLPGTTGWDEFSTNALVTTVLWNPQIQAMGVNMNQFEFSITGTPSIPVVVEVCTNLANPVWNRLMSATLGNGFNYFLDSQWTDYPIRFYRVSSP
jgi:hypothetical protein